MTIKQHRPAPGPIPIPDRRRENSGFDLGIHGRGFLLRHDGDFRQSKHISRRGFLLEFLEDHLEIDNGEFDESLAIGTLKDFIWVHHPCRPRDQFDHEKMSAFSNVFLERSHRRK